MLFSEKKIIVGPSTSNIRKFYVYLIAKFSIVFPESKMENWKSESWIKSSRNGAICS